MIKFFGARVLHDVVDRALQLHGGLGYSTDMPLEMLYRYARHARFVDGADEVHRESVARQILQAYEAPPTSCRPSTSRRRRDGGAREVRRRARRGRRPGLRAWTPSSSTAWQAEPELRDVPVPVPGPGRGARRRSTAAGLCHSDLHIMEWPEGSCRGSSRSRSGTSAAGTVAALGSGRRPGSRSVTGRRLRLVGLRDVPAVRRGAENRLPDAPSGRGAGCGLDGALAGYLLVPSTRLLVPIGGLDPTRAAPLTDAALTPYHAIGRACRCCAPGSSVVVIGIGGLGHPAVQILRALTPGADRGDRARDRRPLARPRGGRGRRARQRATLDPATPRARRRYGAALVLDFVGTDETLRLAASVLGDGRPPERDRARRRHLPVPVESLPFDSSVGRPSWGTSRSSRRWSRSRAPARLTIEVEVFALDEAVATRVPPPARRRGRRAGRWSSRDDVPQRRDDLAAFLDTGLDLRTDWITDDERERTLAWYAEHHDHGDLDLAPFARFQLRHDPTTFKRLRRHILRWAASPRTGLCRSPSACSSSSTPTPSSATASGTLYEIIAVRGLGASARTSQEIARPRGAPRRPSRHQRLAEVADDYLTDWPEDEGAGVAWPEGWAAATDRFRSGINLASDALEPGELELIRGWYERTEGMVPAHVELLAATAPAALKTQRARFETAVRGALPAQLVPLLTVHLSAIRVGPRPSAARSCSPARWGCAAARRCPLCSGRRSTAETS